MNASNLTAVSDQIKKDRGEALLDLYANHKSILIRMIKYALDQKAWLRRYVRTSDIMQDVFVGLLKGAGEVPPGNDLKSPATEIRNMPAYLRAMISNSVTSYGRRRTNRPPVEGEEMSLPDHSLTPAEVAESKDDIRWVLDQLSTAEREWVEQQLKGFTREQIFGTKHSSGERRFQRRLKDLRNQKPALERKVRK